MENNKRYFLIIPLALGIYLISKLVSLVFGVNLTLEHGFFFLWFVATTVLRISSRFNLIAGLIVLSFAPFLLIFKNEPGADRAAVFAFLLFTVGAIQQVWGQLSAQKSPP